MLLRELFTTQNQNILLEGIDHPEDLIITQGSAGAERVIKELEGLGKNTKTVSIKWDGFPAVVFGRNANGELVFMDKHMFDKVVNGKMDFMTIKDYDEQRGANRSDLWDKEAALRPLLEKIVPNISDRYWMGDLMWVGTPPVSNGYYVFKPNTVEYRVKIDDTPGKGDTLSDKIARSGGGIAMHTFIPGLGQSDQPLEGLKGLAENDGITFLTGEMKDKPRVLVNPDLLNSTKQVIDEHKAAVDKFINDLGTMKAKSVLTAMSPFITRMLEENDIGSDIVPRFLEFLKERLTPSAAAKMLGDNNNGWLYQENGGGPGLLGIWTMWAAITDLKMHIKRQIDDQQEGSEVQAFIDTATGHEGYVFGAGADKLKLVDRLGFTRAHFAKFAVSPEEIAAKESGPMAVFCFGRMNPPTLGHGLVLRKTVELGGENAFIFLSNSVDPKENPLDPATKAEFIKQIYPDVANNIVSDFVQGPIYAANWLYAKGYRNMTFVAGSDRLGKEKGSLEKILNSWNSGPIRTTDPAGAREHVVMKYVSAGARDPDSEGITGYSGTKARAAAAANNEAQFQQYTGVGPKVAVNGKSLFQAVQDGIGVQAKTIAAAPVKKPTAKKTPKEVQVEHIVKHGSGYRLLSKSGGKNLGTYSSKSQAEKRERQVQYFKHKGMKTTKEDAAGVGIITKQNSTVDVNKGTPRKNLKAFHLTDAVYQGNIGFKELIDFYSKAREENPRLADEVRELIKQKQNKEAWKIIQTFLNTRLIGKEFGHDIEETYHGDDFFEAYGVLWYNEDEQLDEAEYQGRKVPLGKPMKGDVKKFKVYVKNPAGRIVKVNFGDPNMTIKKHLPKHRKSFRARHNCDNPGPRTKARFWSCRKW